MGHRAPGSQATLPGKEGSLPFVDTVIWETVFTLATSCRAWVTFQDLHTLRALISIYVFYRVSKQPPRLQIKKSGSMRTFLPIFKQQFYR